MTEQQIQQIVEEVLRNLPRQESAPLKTYAPKPASGGTGRWLCDTVEEAVANAKAAQRQLAEMTLEKRGELGDKKDKGFYINVNGDAAGAARSLWRKGCDTRVVVERDGVTLVNLSVLFMLLALLLGWRLVVVAALLALALGCRVKLVRPEAERAPVPSAKPEPEKAPEPAAEGKKDDYNSITIE